MRPTTAQQLLQINRRFYRRFSEPFARTRNRPWPGWSRVVDLYRNRPGLEAETLKFLDLGCGNGRAWPFFSRRFDGQIRIVGLDSSLDLLLSARRASSASRVRGVAALADLYAPEGFPVHADQFDLTVAFGMLHHIPSREGRLRIMQTALETLRSGGILAVTFWRRSVLSRKRVLAWEEYRRLAQRPLDRDDLDTGDVLLAWGPEAAPPDTTAVRYCHLFDDDEVRAIADAVRGSEIVDRYVSDGPGGTDNWYLILRRSE